ncbi:MAG: GAF domain-containing SpoIIE family protein phosphatase [Thermoanaerobaculia bacterium]|nr:GAF domain-containing SpoIIE family protein phosphatase [Thermoanaerobaculia bacterium]
MSPGPADRALEPAVWARFLPVPADDSGDLLFLEGLLELWCRSRETAGAALYVEGERGLERQAAFGSGTFPRRLARTTAGPGPEFERYDLSGGVLLVRPLPGARKASTTDSVDLLLAAGVRLARLRERWKREQFQANLKGVELDAVYEVGLAIASTLDLERLTEEILLRAVALLDARRGALYLLEDDEFRLVSTIGSAAHASFTDDGGAVTAAELLPDAQHPMVTPILVEGRRKGLLAVADKESRQGIGPFSSADERSLELFANQAAIALENARLHQEALEKERLERDLQLAAEIQRRILPKGTPEIPGFEIAGWNRSAREIGGDYYDFIPLADSQLGIVLGDVSGKGVPAALLVSTLHSAIRLLIDRLEFGPALFHQLNRHIVESSAPNKFVTLIVGRLEAATGRFGYVNAGHNPGLVLRADGTLERLPAGGVPVGLLPQASFLSQELTLEPGDLLCLYSDGITECTTLDDREFGEDGLIDVLRTTSGKTLQDIVDWIDGAVTDFAGDGPQGDDQTVVLIRRRG